MSTPRRTKVKFFADVNYPNYKLSFSLQGWTPATYDAHNVYYTLLSTRDPSGRGQNNNGGYANPKVDELTEAMAHELNRDRRQQEIDDAAKLVQDDVATIPLHQQVIVWAARNNRSRLTQPADNAVLPALGDAW